MDITKEIAQVDEQIKQARIDLLNAEAAWNVEQKRLRKAWNDLMEKRTELLNKKKK